MRSLGFLRRWRRVVVHLHDVGDEGAGVQPDAHAIARAERACGTQRAARGVLRDGVAARQDRERREGVEARRVFGEAADD